jgi:prepilin-type N-terminal cleavage/methylation domain-containing protein
MNNRGFSFVEVMAASMISGVALMAMVSMMQMASRQVQQGGVSTRALALAQARVEAKRSVRWQALLEDDLDHDGNPETFMNDDGVNGDLAGGDGIYTAMQQNRDVTLFWTVEADPRGSLKTAGLIVIRATASYQGSSGAQEVKVETIRANPMFVGQ